MVRSEGRIVVVGGANLDVVGRPFQPLLPYESNPGYIRRSAGGVGRNIAENLARLGIDTSLITAFGSDADASRVAEECTRAGIDVSASLQVQLPESTYLAVLDDSGDLEMAISDMRPIERLTPEALMDRAGVFTSAAVVVVDANLLPETLDWLATETAAPLVFDPVSAAKAPKAASILGDVAAVKCNLAEAKALLGIAEDGVSDGAELAKLLLGAGAESAYVTAGAAGTWYATTSERGHVEAPRAAMTNATGAGDAFAAGVAAAMLFNTTAPHAAAFGTKLAALTLASEHTVSEHVTPELLEEAAAEWR